MGSVGMDYRLPKAEMDRKGVSVATVAGQCWNGLSIATSRNELEKGYGGTNRSPGSLVEE